MSSFDTTVAQAIVLYSACSSTLLVVNKAAVKIVMSSSLVLLVQLITSVLAVLYLNYKMPKVIEVESIVYDKAKGFSAAAVLFCLCLYTNVQALKNSTIETVIVFRACSPIAVSFIDFLCLGREFPNRRSLLSMLGIIAGAYLYFLSAQKPTNTNASTSSSSSSTDSTSVNEGSSVWVTAYFVCIVIEMAFVQYVIENLKMTTWTRMYYNNALSIPVIVFIGLITGDFMSLNHEGVDLGLKGVSIMLLAGVMGCVMSYSGFNLRQYISATSFTVIGVLCKLGTLLLNHILWTSEISALGYFGLVGCIVAGTFYQQAPKLKSPEMAALAEATTDDEEIGQKVIFGKLQPRP